MSPTLTPVGVWGSFHSSEEMCFVKRFGRVRKPRKWPIVLAVQHRKGPTHGNELAILSRSSSRTHRDHLRLVDLWCLEGTQRSVTEVTGGQRRRLEKVSKRWIGVDADADGTARTLDTADSGNKIPPTLLVGATIFSTSTRSSRGIKRLAIVAFVRARRSARRRGVSSRKGLCFWRAARFGQGATRDL